MVNTPFFAEYQIVGNTGGETPPLRMDNVIVIVGNRSLRIQGVAIAVRFLTALCLN